MTSVLDFQFHAFLRLTIFYNNTIQSFCQIRKVWPWIRGFSKCLSITLVLNHIQNYSTVKSSWQHFNLVVTAFNGRPPVVFKRWKEMSKVKLSFFEKPTSTGTQVQFGSLVLNTRLGSMNLNIQAPTNPTLQHHLVRLRGLRDKTALQS